MASEAIAQRESSWSPRSGTVPDLSFDAISAVWIHCPGLPDEIRLVLDVVVDHAAMPSPAALAIAEGRPLPAANDDDPLDAKLPGHARHHELGGEAWGEALRWRSSVCADYAAVAESMSHAPAAERGAILWDRCLGPSDLVTREEYVATIRESGAVGFALHGWLTEQAQVTPAVAKPLARAVVLGSHWLVRPSTGLLLPAAASTTPVDDGVVLELGPKAIRFGGRVIAELDAAGRLETERVPSHPEPIIGPLYDLLAEEVEKSRQMSEGAGEPWSSSLLLMAHRELPWSAVRPVLASAVLAGWPRVAVVVLADDRAAPLRTVVVHRADDGTQPEHDDATTVQAVVDGLVTSRGDASPAGR